jgi:hypothetical protein
MAKKGCFANDDDDDDDDDDDKGTVWTPIKYKQMQYYKEWGHVYQGVV